MAKTPYDTPAMRQWSEFKEQYPDYLLFFRMGDFYELFADDAKTAARILGIAVTTRNKGANAIPLAGIPYHALDNYLRRLVAEGIRVAICEQVEDPKTAKGVVKRDVVRLVTPGTLTDETLLDQREGNYLAAIFQAKTATAKRDALVGLSWVELSSGQFFTMTAPAEHVVDELIRIRPAEVVLAEDSHFDQREWTAQLSAATSAVATRRPPWVFDIHAATEALHEQFAVTTLAGFGIETADEGVCAAGALLDYLRETQKSALGHIRKLMPFQRERYMAIDGNTLRCLEVQRTLRDNVRTGSLLASLDQTKTGMGSRLLERWLTYPLVNYSAILARQEAVAFFAESADAVAALRTILADCAQIDRISTNIALNRVRPREVLALGQTLANLPALAASLEGAPGLLNDLAPALDGLDEPAAWIEATIDPDCSALLRDGGVIATGFDEELDRLRTIGRDGETWLADYQKKLAEQYDLPLKMGFNRVFGYYIEISRLHSDKAPPEFHRKQTLKNAERYITDELKQYESEVLTAEERAKNLEAKLFEELRVKLADCLEELQAAAEALATIDVLAALGHLARSRDYTRPTITQDNVLEINGGKHPVVAEELREKFVPNDVTMGGDIDRLLLITGPNMAGKSTYIRQVALLVLLAQTGSFIPAESATIGIADRIFTRVGAADELAKGLSTFMLEMVETANILNNATSRSLVILDEVGRGTSTCDGLALAWAICEFIANHCRCRTLFATHYHELTELDSVLPATTNLNVSVREWHDEVVFLHKIIPGPAEASYGVHVAKLAGVPKEVTQRARELLPQLQEHFATGLDLPELAETARQEIEQFNLFASPADRVAADISAADLDNMSPIEAHAFLRRLKSEL
ncbi:MAG: DNA mismatch repair protein MutS [Phycisphaerales bacterium]|jgi:DNA mismatch repair protein MutS|nr:DNA mismatch repair protein MutS [Phycisphaerales bacterium]MBT7170462.1 DNA mismatch repair protein MutS [Phycisphaerales bacterium]